MVTNGHPAATALALVFAAALGCQSGPSPEAQARLDSLSLAVADKDRLVQEVAENARVLSEISAELVKVQVPARALRVSSESPLRASRDSMLQKIRYVSRRLGETETRLGEQRKRVGELSQLSDSLRATLEATIANYDTVIETQRVAITALHEQVNQLTAENIALRDTVGTMSIRENTVFYVIGTKEELLQKGIVVEQGGGRVLFVLWKTGKTLAPARDFDPSYFTPINKRNVTEIPLAGPDKTYLIASRQDLDFLATPPNGDGKITGTAALRIAQPEQFWANSKFLIIVEQG